MKKEHFSNHSAQTLIMQKEKARLYVKMDILSPQKKEKYHWWLDYLTTDYSEKKRFDQGDFLNCIIGKNLSFRS